MTRKRHKATSNQRGPHATAPTGKKAVSRKVHAWRACPYGEHWVRTHPLRVPPSKSNPAGSVTTRHAHCAENPSGKDQLYPDEIREIANRRFSGLKNMPCSLSLKFKNGSQYDRLIAGWVRYWNDILQPKDRLDPNLVKALIASESGFDPLMLANKRNQNSARGLLQITNDTRKILGSEKGEIRDRYITTIREELNDPSVNICAGIRWLFHKRTLASARLRRPATWLDAVFEYKGLAKATKKRAAVLMGRFNEIHEAFAKCGKP